MYVSGANMRRDKNRPGVGLCSPIWPYGLRWERDHWKAVLVAVQLNSTCATPPASRTTGSCLEGSRVASQRNSVWIPAHGLKQRPDFIYDDIIAFRCIWGVGYNLGRRTRLWRGCLSPLKNQSRTKIWTSELGILIRDRRKVVLHISSAYSAHTV